MNMSSCRKIRNSCAVINNTTAVCKFHFSERITVEDGDHKIVTIYGDAEHIRINNDTDDLLYLYLVLYGSPSWGLPIDDISPGYY